ncbi:MAG: acyltransferase [Jatrophihabitans sp.]
MSGWPELRESRIVQAGHSPGTVIRCGLTDTMLADLPVSVVFLYRQAPDFDRLAAGLARALQLLPVFAGRLRTIDGDLQLVCDDAGVPLTSYTVDETLSEAIGRVTLPGSGYVDHVDAPKARLGGLPLFSARVSWLSDGGMVLGCSWHHAVGDVQTFMLLMHAWSAAVEGRPLPPVVIPEDPDAYLDRVLPPQDSGRPGFRLLDTDEAALVRREIERAMRTNRTVQVYFGDAELARLRESYIATAGRRLSTNDVVCAHVVSTIRQLDEDDQARDLAMPVNIRRLLELPAGAVGNLVNEVFLTCPPRSSGEEFAVQLRQAVEDFARSHLNLRANHAFLAEIGPDRFGDCVPIGFDPSRRTVTITNWSRFGMYEVAFDGFRPAFFSSAANLQLPWIAWIVEGFDNTGLLLTATVPGTLAARLRSSDGRAALHRFREPADELPELAGTVRKLI